MKYILKILSIVIIKQLQKKYKAITNKNRYNQTNQVLAKLRLIQSVLYYFKNQFSAWGFFHPDCVWTEKDEIYFRKLFPEKNFEELETIIWYNPEAIPYYHNKIWNLTDGKPPIYSIEIEKQLKEWNDWN